ncbi:hypothetical protein E0H50_41000 [Kribbella sindirgiensis]|uniref:Uncharacterized protein n=1 Tax=Kribbella sindirgiensis TaxID=1124744 RepID=A0A4R0HXH7_9ACTN|nr:hypothetical protein E0H50_41000 [Kribbella sindirgiensis]
MLFPIPPATISFHGWAVVHPPGVDPPVPALARLVPADLLANCRIVEIVPDGEFRTYGIGTSLLKLLKSRDPVAGAEVTARQSVGRDVVRPLSGGR